MPNGMNSNNLINIESKRTKEVGDYQKYVNSMFGHRLYKKLNHFSECVLICVLPKVELH